MRAVLHPEPVTPVPILPRETSKSYLQKCERNIRAEIWGLYSSKVNPAFARDALMGRVELSLRAGAELVATGKDTDAIEWNLVVIGDSLFLALPLDKDTLKLLRGKRISDKPSRLEGPCRAHVIGFVRPFVKDLDSIAALQASAPTSLLSEVASPASRTRFAYNAGQFSQRVPSNTHQRGVISAMSSSIECIQGPPGTGKSTTIFHILNTALPPSFVAIVTCVQNKAIDAISEKLNGNIDFVVYGNRERLGDSSARNTLDALVCQTASVSCADRRVSVCQGIVDLLHKRLSTIELSRFAGSPAWHRWWLHFVRLRHAGLLADIAAREADLEQARCERTVQFEREGVAITEGARAFLCTMDSLSQVRIPKNKRSIAVIDEAGTVPEYKLPLLVAHGVQAIVSIGDQNQLTPFTHSGHQGGLQGFFQRATEVLKPVPMLIEQYRMHPAICEFVSGSFYQGALTTSSHTTEARGCGGIWWVDYEAHSEARTRTKGLFNQLELDMMRQHMRANIHGLLRRGKSVMIITFYREQFQRLMRVGEEEGLVSADTARFAHPLFRIATVDSAQGSEADIVILSCVRSNGRGTIGFLSNRNRQCVAFSRAREWLCVFGHSGTLRSNAVWSGLYDRSRGVLLH
jgi:hypothetical protein